MKRLLKVTGVLSLFLLTAQSCTVDPGGPGGVGPVVGPGGGGRVFACFRNSTPRTKFYRVEWLDGTGRVRVFRTSPYSRSRIFIGRRPAQWCFAYRPGLVTNLACQRPIRVNNNC